MIVEPELELAAMMAPRKLQSSGAAVQADSMGKSAVVSTVYVAAGGVITGAARSSTSRPALLLELPRVLAFGKSALREFLEWDSTTALNPANTTSATKRTETKTR